MNGFLGKVVTMGCFRFGGGYLPLMCDSFVYEIDVGVFLLLF